MILELEYHSAGFVVFTKSEVGDQLCSTLGHATQCCTEEKNLIYYSEYNSLFNSLEIYVFLWPNDFSNISALHVEYNAGLLSVIKISPW